MTNVKLFSFPWPILNQSAACNISNQADQPWNSTYDQLKNEATDLKNSLFLNWILIYYNYSCDCYCKWFYHFITYLSAGKWTLIRKVTCITIYLHSTINDNYNVACVILYIRTYLCNTHVYNALYILQG